MTFLIGFPLAFGLAFAGARLARGAEMPVRATAIAAGAAIGVALAAQVRLQILEPGVVDQVPLPLALARDAALALAVAFPIALLAIAAVDVSAAAYSCAWERRPLSSRA